MAKRGGVNTLAKIKCLRCRTALIQSALCSPDLGECFTYPEHVPNCYKKFFRGSRSQKLQKKTTNWLRWFRVVETQFYQKIKKFHVCSNKKWLRRRTVLIQSALCSPDLGQGFTYPEHVFNLCRKFFRGSHKVKNSPKSVKYSEAKLAFWELIFTKMQNFRLCFNINWLKCPMGLIQNALCSPDLGDGFTYPEHWYNLCRKFSRDTQSNPWQNILAAKKLFWSGF